MNALKEKAQNDELILLLECKQYTNENKKKNNIYGFESLEIYYKECILCSIYQMSHVPYETLKEGGIHSTSVFIFFMCCIYFFPEMQLYVEKYKTELWYNEIKHFIEPLDFDIYDYDNSIDNMKQFIRMRAKLRGGLPANIPYSFICACTVKQIQQLFPTEPIDTIVKQKTLIEREYYMAENIKKVLSTNNSTKDIHVCIGAGHLMPKLSQTIINDLGLDLFFVDYHNQIKELRLLDYLKEYEFLIQLL
jgi:hypothetical protein